MVFVDHLLWSVAGGQLWVYGVTPVSPSVKDASTKNVNDAVMSPTVGSHSFLLSHLRFPVSAEQKLLSAAFPVGSKPPVDVLRGEADVKGAGSSGDEPRSHLLPRSSIKKVN